MLKKFFIIFTSLLLYFFTFSFSHAQFNFGSAASGQPVVGTLADELTITLSPTYPKPKDQVSVYLEMYTEDLNSANISAYLDGKLLAKGKGLRNFSFQAPSAGASAKLTINVSLLNGLSFTKEITIKPAGLDLLWQATSYTPPFYAGRAFFSPQGFVKVWALPKFSSSNISSVANVSNLVYKWTVDGEVRQDLGGYGKNTALIRDSILGRPIQIEVTATDPSTNVTAVAQLILSPVTPLVLFYENNPLYGIIYEKSINNSEDSTFDLVKEETNIVAAPFNFSLDDLNNIKYDWKINGLSQSSILGRSAIFRKPADVSGSSNVSLDIENSAKPLESADGSLIIKFTNNNNANNNASL